jgi:hypothetical protein
MVALELPATTPMMAVTARLDCSVLGKASGAVYYGEDLFDDDVDEDRSDGLDSTLAGVVLGVVEAAAWLIGVAIVGAVASTDLRSSPWLWVVLVALPLLVAVALWLRRTRQQERIMLRPTERS